MQSHANGGNANGGNQMSPSQFHNTVIASIYKRYIELKS